MLPAEAPFTFERVVTAPRFVLDADRNNPDHARELLTSAADVTTQAVTAHRTFFTRWALVRSAKNRAVGRVEAHYSGTLWTTTERDS